MRRTKLSGSASDSPPTASKSPLVRPLTVVVVVVVIIVVVVIVIVVIVIVVVVCWCF